jgi:hypothetical protein
MNQPIEACLIELPRHARADGEVIVDEAAAQVPFRIERMFALAAPAGAKRGRHAHRLCSLEFRQNESLLIVLCDCVYELHDYIRDYAEFVSFRESVRA